MAVSTELFLIVASFLAGFIDSIAGGGGLIQLPALFIALPASPPPLVLGTNKFVALAGTSMAVSRYARHVRIPWRDIALPALAAFAAAFAGARATALINPSEFKPLVLCSLVAVAAIIYKRKDLGSVHAPHLSRAKAISIGVGVALGIGFYDGFIGPGTGTFFMFVFVGLFRFDFINASVSAKILNCATNLSALLFFIAGGHVWWRLAALLAACNALGAITGSHLAISKGSLFVRRLFLVVVTFVIARFAWDLFG